MSTQESRRRAPAMSSEQRRTEIVRATLPLLAEQGANVTTRAIAQAADVAEGTVFRVFTDKGELLRACLAEAFRTDEVCARIREISTSQSIDARLTEGAALVLDHFDRLGELKRNLAASDYDLHQRETHDAKRAARHEPPRFVLELTDAFAALIAPDEQRLRVPVEDVAAMLLGLLLSARFAGNSDDEARAKLAPRIDVLLRGALAA
ncbi:TetR/AcrR family transcriptional regulator [Actinopolyspora alba]|uniref:TetR/AcrR family transcriptional regulator n=1 Tax=Actinopolyspora alba TaxID=673379 RepID=UPI001FDF6A58|nr:helix-turn-helix domain-containing protein [Actinopolyspora alba]